MYFWTIFLFGELQIYDTISGDNSLVLTLAKPVEYSHKFMDWYDSEATGPYPEQVQFSPAIHPNSLTSGFILLSLLR
jgi:hypothetical protein